MGGEGVSDSATLTVEVGDPLAKDQRFLDWLTEQGIDYTYIFRLELSDDEILARGYEPKESGRGIAVTYESGSPEPLLAEPVRVKLSAPLPQWVIGGVVPASWRRSVAVKEQPA
jgi:hypothetical protein